MIMDDHGSIYFQSFQSEGVVILKCVVCMSALWTALSLMCVKA